VVGGPVETGPFRVVGQNKRDVGHPAWQLEGVASGGLSGLAEGGEGGEDFGDAGAGGWAEGGSDLLWGLW